MPLHDLGHSVEVLLELPGEPGLADAGDAHDRDEVRLGLVGARVEELLQEAKLALTTDERGLERVGLEASAPSGGDADRAPQRERLRLPLQLVRARVLVRDRGLRRAPRRLADEDGARLCEALDAGGGVDEIACDHPLALSAEGDRGLAREYGGAGGERRSPQLGAERGDCRERGRALPARLVRRRPLEPSAYPRRPSRHRR